MARYKSGRQKPLTLCLIIPVYNEQNYLRRCLQAIEAQTEKPDEVIVVDNNSTDKSAQIAAEFSFVKVAKEKKQGIVYARNRGFNTARADILARIDADTQLPADWVAKARRLAASIGQLDAVTGPCSFRNTFWPKGIFWFHRLIYFWSSRLLFGHHILFGSNMFLLRSGWQQVKNQVCTDNSLHEDMDLSHHLASAGGKIRFEHELAASISARRFHNAQRYPLMWIKTRLVHYRGRRLSNR